MLHRPSFPNQVLSGVHPNAGHLALHTMGVKKSVLVTRMFQQDRVWACTVSDSHETRLMFAVVLVGFFLHLGVRLVTRQSHGNWTGVSTRELGVGVGIYGFESGRRSCCKFLDMFSGPLHEAGSETQFPKLCAHGSLYEARYLKQSNSKCLLTALSLGPFRTSRSYDVIGTLSL